MGQGDLGRPGRALSALFRAAGFRRRAFVQAGEIVLHALAKWSDRLVEAAAVVLLLAMLAAVFLGVVFRLVGEPLAWSDELAQYLLVWTAFIGWIIASRRRSHIRIGLIIGSAQRLAPAGSRNRHPDSWWPHSALSC